MQRVAKEILKNDCFDRLRAESDDFDAEVVARVSAVAGDVGTDGLGLDDDGLRRLSHCDIVVHSAASVSFDSPLDAAVEVNLLGPSRVAEAMVRARALAADEGRTGPVHYIPVSTAYVAGTHQGEAREELLADNRFSLDIDWRAEVHAARRQRGDSDAESRRPERLEAVPQGGPGGARRRRPAPARRAGRATSARTGSSSRWSRSARRGPRRSGGPTPTPTPRPSASGPCLAVRRHAAHHHRPPVDHRVGAGRAPPGLDPRLPDGRADHHLLRPRPAEGVPRRPRGHHRRHPRRPGGGRHPRGGRPRPCSSRRRRPSGARRVPRGLRGPEPASATAGWSSWSSAWFTGAPALRQPTASPSSCPSGRSPGAAGSSAS